jgi:ribose 5-phosphate isomerase A
MTEAIEAQKRAAAFAAVAEVESGMLVGIGTGSTSAYAINALTDRIAQGLTIRAVATSARTAAAAEAAGIPINDFGDLAAVDLCIDGVDEIDPSLRAIKGAGGAMLREKVIASAAARMIAIADSTKPVARLGTKLLPIEVLSFARSFVQTRVGALGGVCELRCAGGRTPVQTDQGNLVLDCSFAPFPDPVALSIALDAIPGVIGHGLFLDQIDAIYVGEVRGVRLLERYPNGPAPETAAPPAPGRDTRSN